LPGFTHEHRLQSQHRRRLPDPPEDISGNVPIGEQYNDFTFFDVLGEWGEVYNDIGVTPEAFLITPFGDIVFPTAFVEAVGPTFFEPWASVGL
jgi:hypothetical protein